MTTNNKRGKKNKSLIIEPGLLLKHNGINVIQCLHFFHYIDPEFKVYPKRVLFDINESVLAGSLCLLGISKREVKYSSINPYNAETTFSKDKYITVSDWVAKFLWLKPNIVHPEIIYKVDACRHHMNHWIKENFVALTLEDSEHNEISS